jgi:hypothetical protein
MARSALLAIVLTSCLAASALADTDAACTGEDTASMLQVKGDAHPKEGDAHPKAVAQTNLAVDAVNASDNASNPGEVTYPYINSHPNDHSPQAKAISRAWAGYVPPAPSTEAPTEAPTTTEARTTTEAPTEAPTEAQSRDSSAPSNPFSRILPPHQPQMPQR